MNIDQKGIELLKEFEGLRLTAYQDSGGLWTIGIGTIRYEDGTPVKKGDVITKERSEELLLHEVSKSVQAVNDYISVELTQNQFDALVSFTYNLGIGALKNSTLRKKVNVKDFDGAAKEFLRWCNVNGKMIPGLLKRRTKESFLFLSNS